MTERSSWQPVRGIRDVLPPEQRHLAAVETALVDALTGWGYAPVSLPLVERRELYLRKAGEDMVGKLYDWVHHGRALALRPEWTASVLRAFLRGQQAEPLPVRVRYNGPVFRYERPQRTTYRQFTQIGVELIGGNAPRADVEVLALACAGLQQADVADWTLTLGHVGIVRAVLGQLGLTERTASQLLWSLERLRNEGSAAIKAEFSAGDAVEQWNLGPLAALPDAELQTLLLTLLRSVGLPLDNSTRSPEAIVARLVRKLRRGDEQPALERALAVLERLSAIRDAPGPALAAAAAVLDDEGLDAAPLAELRTIVQLLEQTNTELPPIMVDLGLTRGLHYYTGLIFEINGADGLQLCGGGRYDDLVASLGGPSTPAVGFAYGLERVAAVATPPPLPTRPLVVVMAGAEQYAAAVAAVARLHADGYATLLDARARTLAANLRDAARRGAQAVVVVDGEELAWHRVDDG